MAKLEAIDDDRNRTITTHWNRLADIAPSEGQKVHFAYLTDIAVE